MDKLADYVQLLPLPKDWSGTEYSAGVNKYIHSYIETRPEGQLNTDRTCFYFASMISHQLVLSPFMPFGKYRRISCTGKTHVDKLACLKNQQSTYCDCTLHS